MKAIDATMVFKISRQYRKGREMAKYRSIPVAHKLQMEALPRETNPELKTLHTVGPKGQYG